MRLLDKTRTFRELDKMGFSEHDFKLVQLAIEEPNGIVFVTGPTGSGKTTTLYSILSALNKTDTNIITVEDPVEYSASWYCASASTRKGRAYLCDCIAFDFAARS